MLMLSFNDDGGVGGESGRPGCGMRVRETGLEQRLEQREAASIELVRKGSKYNFVHGHSSPLAKIIIVLLPPLLRERALQAAPRTKEAQECDLSILVSARVYKLFLT